MTLGRELDSHHVGAERLTCGWRRAVILRVLCGAGVCAMQVLSCSSLPPVPSSYCPAPRPLRPSVCNLWVSHVAQW